MEKLQIYKELNEFRQYCQNATTPSNGELEVKIWTQKVDRRLSKLYGEDSAERKAFLEIPFHIGFLDDGSTLNQLFRARKYLFDCAAKVFADFIEELELPWDVTHTSFTKIHVSSHQSDQALAELLKKLLISIGVKEYQFSMSSIMDDQATDGLNQTIPKLASKGVLVLVLLSENFVKSLNCLMEFGAASALTARVISLHVPPVAKITSLKLPSDNEELKITDGICLSELKKQIENLLSIKPDKDQNWPVIRNAFLEDTLQLLET
ncbi:MAG: hypothetical protein C0433_05880 [Cyclobacterium sp.]|nr:hypothetical protein [Cyclobacterium sp.]